MTSATIRLRSQSSRQVAANACLKAPFDAVMTIKAYKRTTPQNAKWHAMITEISRQLTWHGQKWPMDAWKTNLIACFKSDIAIMPRADGFGVVPINGTSDLTRSEGSDFIEFIYAFGCKHGVIFADDNDGKV